MSNTASMGNTNRWTTRQMVVMALMVAISVIVSFIEFPIIAAAPFLKLDVSLAVVAIVGFAYGAGPGLVVGILSVIIHSLFMGDLAGGIMNTLVIIGYILPSTLIYRRGKNLKSAIIGLIVGSIGLIIMALLGNLFVTPVYTGMPVDAIVAMIPTILLPFNLIKAVVNSVLVALLYRSVGKIINPGAKIA